MTEEIYREHFEEAWINHEMNKKAISYVKAQAELQAWKKQNKKEYKDQFDDFIDEIRGF